MLLRFLKMSILFSSCFTRVIVHVLIAVTSANSASDSQTPYPPKTYDKMMVCNLAQDSRLNEATYQIGSETGRSCSASQQDLHFATKVNR